MKLMTRATLAIAALAAIESAWAIPIQLQPGAEGKDTQLISGLPTANWGDATEVITNWAGNYRSIGLIEFDLSSVPAGSSVNSASLDLYHLFNINAGQTYSLFRVTSAWTEATTFATAPTFDPVAVASLIIPDASAGLFRSWDVTSVVTGWLDGSFANFGLWIEEVPVQASGTAYFASSDHSAEAFRPRLNIDYSVGGPVPVPEPGTLVLLGGALLALGASRRRAMRR